MNKIAKLALVLVFILIVVITLVTTVKPVRDEYCIDDIAGADPLHKEQVEFDINYCN